MQERIVWESRLDKPWAVDSESSEEYQTSEVLDEKRSTEYDRYLVYQSGKKNGNIVFRPHYVKNYRSLIHPVSGKVQTVKSSNEQATEWQFRVRYINANLRWYCDTSLEPVFDHKYDLDELMTLAYADANSAELDLLTALAELPETIKMFQEMVKVLIRPRREGAKFFALYRNALKEGKGKVSSLALSHLSSAWLQYRYGIMPVYYLLNDINSAFDKVIQLFESTRKHDKASLNEVKFETYRIWLGGLAQELVFTHEIRGDSSLRVLLKRRYSLDGLLNHKKFGLNPAQTMWELTTLSFVVDWAIQVGDFIAALSPSCASEEAWTSSSRFRAKYVIRVSKRRPPKGLTTSGFSGPVFEASWNNYERNVGTGTPDLSIPVGLNMNLKRTLDAFALTWPSLRSSLHKK